MALNVDPRTVQGLQKGSQLRNDEKNEKEQESLSYLFSARKLLVLVVAVLDRSWRTERETAVLISV